MVRSANCVPVGASAGRSGVASLVNLDPSIGAGQLLRIEWVGGGDPPEAVPDGQPGQEQGSWFIFDRYQAHEDWCGWRAPFWHGSRVMDGSSHHNYHLGFRCCKTLSPTISEQSGKTGNAEERP